jgi:uncharacterized membrane protein
MQQAAPTPPPAQPMPDKTLVWVAYGAMALAFVNGFSSVITVVIGYVKRNEVPPWLATHYTFLIRTFWITLVVGLVGVILTVVLVGFLVLPALAVWIIVRLVRGAIWLSEDKPVPQPLSLGFG